MDAIISGRAGIAILKQDKALWTLDVDSSEKITRKQADLPYLLGDSSDLQFLENIDVKEVATELQHAISCDEALHLALILLDPELSDEVRQEASQVLEAMSWEEDVIYSVLGVLYAQPLPESADVEGAIAACSASRSPVILGWLQSLEEQQPAIRMVRTAWEAIPLSVFGSEEMRARFQAAAVREGLFWDLVQHCVSIDSASMFETEILDSPAFGEPSQSRQILTLWLSYLDRIEKGSNEIIDEAMQETEIYDQRRRVLGKAVDRLPDRERVVLALYYYEKMTFREIGKVLILSQSRVYQLHTQAILRLHGYLQNDADLFQVSSES